MKDFIMNTKTLYYCNYSIGENPYENVSKICKRYGKRILLIGGEKALQAGKERLHKNLAESELELIDTVLFGKDCTYHRIHQLAAYARKIDADMIFGMGGGKALDTAKGAAWEANLPVFTFPTIAATCAATTALSVVYQDDGNFDSFYYFDHPAAHCFIDLTIIAQAPLCYLRAGMGDTIGKFFECHFAARGDKLAHHSALGREISNMCYEPLLEYGEQALSDCLSHRVSTALEQTVLANIISTGLVSLLVLDEYNCAIAHSVYYGLVLLPGFEETWLHGNVVAYGVLVQLAVDQKLEEAKKVKRFLQKLQIPTTLQEMKIPVNRDYLKDVLTETVSGPDMEHIPYPVTEDMIYRAIEEIEHLHIETKE